ncbi:hypothetical protein [Rubrobacter tropicus]|nr:hypothetical protein [Rubrobacter tropicus]
METAWIYAAIRFERGRLVDNRVAIRVFFVGGLGRATPVSGRWW